MFPLLLPSKLLRWPFIGFRQHLNERRQPMQPRLSVVSPGSRGEIQDAAHSIEREVYRLRLQGPRRRRFAGLHGLYKGLECFVIDLVERQFSDEGNHQPEQIDVELE